MKSVAITDGPHSAYLAMMPLSSETEFRLFQIPITKINTGKTIYPIGAGDSVAAGMLAAWKILSDKSTTSTSSSSSQPRIDPDIIEALAGNESPTTRAILTSFSFGLACGTASCYNEENSVVKVPDVLDIFKKQERPMFISSHKVS